MRVSIAIPLKIGFLCILPLALLHSQENTASWNAISRISANVPILPESFQTCWKTTVGTGLDLVWYAGRKTGFTLDLSYMPFSLDREQWTERLEPKMEGIGRLEFKQGSLRAFTASAGIKRLFPFADRPFLFYIRVAGECAYLRQEELHVDAVFSERTINQHLRLGDSQLVAGGCAAIGTEIQLNPQWGVTVEGAFHYFATQKQKSPSSDLNIRIMVPPDEMGRGFCEASAGLIYYFGYSNPMP